MEITDYAKAGSIKTKEDIVVSTLTDNQIILIHDNAEINILYTASEKFKSAPTIAEIDGENYIFAGNDNDRLYGLKSDGELVYEFLTEDRIRTSPAFYKYGNSVSIFYGSYDGFIYGKDKHGYVDYVKGANIAGFVKVADAMLAQGVV